MRATFLSRKIMLFVTTPIICIVSCIVIFILSSDVHLGECRDEYLPRVPNYPNSVLLEVNKDIAETDQNTGSVVQIYLAPTSTDNVVNFYEEYGACHALQDSDSTFCSNTIEHRLLYEIVISQEEDNTIYEVTSIWDCGRSIFD